MSCRPFAADTWLDLSFCFSVNMRWSEIGDCRENIHPSLGSDVRCNDCCFREIACAFSLGILGLFT